MIKQSHIKRTKYAILTELCNINSEDLDEHNLDHRKSKGIKKKSASLTMQNLWVDQNWNILEEMGIPVHLTCLLRNLYAGQEGTVRTGHGATDWFQIGKGERQVCILSPCLFNLYAEYIVCDAGLDDSEAGIKIARRNVNILRYADGTTLRAS